MPKATVEMIAAKAFRYNTGRVSVGDTFMATPSDARLLAAIGKARATDARDPSRKLPPPPRQLVERIAAFDHDRNGEPGGSSKPEPAADLKALRREYFETLGKRPFAGWNAVVLREKIAAAKA